MACMPGSRRMFPVAVRKGIPCRGQVAAGFFRATLSRRKVVSLFSVILSAALRARSICIRSKQFRGNEVAFDLMKGVARR